MNQYSNQPTLSFSPRAVVERIDGINDPEQRARAIAGILHTYSSTRDRWRDVVTSNPQGLDKQKTSEYAAILGCAPDQRLINCGSTPGQRRDATVVHRGADLCEFRAGGGYDRICDS